MIIDDEIKKAEEHLTELKSQKKRLDGLDNVIYDLKRASSAAYNYMINNDITDEFTSDVSFEDLNVMISNIELRR